jgi:hypothetical protein
MRDKELVKDGTSLLLFERLLKEPDLELLRLAPGRKRLG